MKKTFLIALVLGFSVVASVRAQDATRSPRIAVVDMARISAETVLGKKIQVEIDKLRTEIDAEQKKKQAELAKLDAELQALGQKFESQGAVLSPEAQEKARLEITRKQRERQVYFEDGQADLNSLQRKAQERAEALNREFQEKIRPAIEAVVKDAAVDLLFDSQITVFRSAEFDISSAVITKADENEKTPPAVPAAAAAKPAGPSPAAPKPAKP